MNINEIIVAGRLGKDPELKSTPNGTKVASFSVGTSRTWEDNNKQKQEQTEWFNCIAFGRTAEVIAQYFTKGKPIYLKGRMQTRSWDDKEIAGRKLYRTEMIVEKFYFFPKNEGSANTSTNEHDQTPKYQEKTIDADTGKEVTATKRSTAPTKQVDMDAPLDYGEPINPDDIPF